MTNKHKRFTLRLLPELDKWLTEQAKLYDRSKNEHIVFLLKSIRRTAEENQKRLSLDLRDEIWEAMRKR